MGHCVRPLVIRVLVDYLYGSFYLYLRLSPVCLKLWVKEGEK